jgi:ubiquinone/menaquinone biosynthesis C-methylase UbiE
MEDDMIDVGGLACAQCLKTYPIEEEILQFVSKREVMETYALMEEQARVGARFYDHLLHRFLEILQITLDEGRAEYMERLELIPQAKILDIGVGTGAELLYLWSKTTNVEMFGLDLSIEMLRECQRKLRKANARAELFLGLAECLPFKDNTFDVVFHTGAINEFKDQRAAIEEMVRVAKPGTRIVITDEQLTAQNITQPIGRRLVETFPSLSKDVVPPVGCIPPEMQEKRMDVIWRGYGYCLEFRKPSSER